MAVAAESNSCHIGVGVAVVAKRALIRVPLSVLIAKTRRMRFGIITPTRYAIDVAGDASGITALHVVAASARFQILTCGSRMLPAAAAHAEAHEV